MLSITLGAAREWQDIHLEFYSEQLMKFRLDVHLGELFDFPVKTSESREVLYCKLSAKCGRSLRSFGFDPFLPTQTDSSKCPSWILY